MKLKVLNKDTNQLEDPSNSLKFNFYLLGYFFNFIYIVLMAFVLKTFVPFVFPVVTLGFVHYTIVLILLNIVSRYLFETSLNSFISNLFNFIILFCIYFFIF